MVKIIAVKYLNTLPFVHGIEKSGLINDYILELDIPSACARKLENGEADIGLVPIAALDKLSGFEVFTDYCIGAEKAVGSVLLVGEKPMDELKEIYLDYQSRTTNSLVKIIYSKHLNLSPLWINGNAGFESSIKGSTGGVLIGDRALEIGNNYAFKYDLAELWNQFTGLPFVFACWVAKTTVPKSVLSNFNNAITWGIQHKHDVIQQKKLNIDIQDYFDNYISYHLDEGKRAAMALYLQELRSLGQEERTGP